MDSYLYAAHQRAIKVVEEFKRSYPDWEVYREGMIKFATQYPEFDKPERIADVYKFVKFYNPIDKNSLDYILGLPSKKIK